MKFVLSSKTLQGIIVMAYGFIASLLGVDYPLDEQLIMNVTDGGLNTSDWINIATFLSGLARAVYGRYVTNGEKLTLKIKK